MKSMFFTCYQSHLVSLTQYHYLYCTVHIHIHIHSKSLLKGHIFIFFSKARYCNDECQNEDWEQHRSYCMKRREKRQRRKAKRNQGGDEKGDEDSGDDGEEKEGFIGKLRSLKVEEVD